MNLIRRSISLDPLSDARLRELAAERGQDEAAVLAEAVALLDSVVDIGNPDIAEDRRRLEDFKRTREAVAPHDVKARSKAEALTMSCLGLDALLNIEAAQS